MKQTVAIDSVGRLVLPKSVRQALGIVGRAKLVVEVVAGGVQLSPPLAPSGPTRKRGGRLVYSGPLPPDWDSGKAVSRMREQRMHRHINSAICTAFNAAPFSS